MVGSASQVDQVAESIVDIIDCLRRFHPRQLVTDGAGNGRFSQSATSQQGRPITPTTLFKGIPPYGRLANTKHKYVTLIRITNTKHISKYFINEQNQLKGDKINQLKARCEILMFSSCMVSIQHLIGEYLTQKASYLSKGWSLKTQSVGNIRVGEQGLILNTVQCPM